MPRLYLASHIRHGLAVTMASRHGNLTTEVFFNKAFELTVGLVVIWDAITLIWRQRKEVWMGVGWIYHANTSTIADT